MTSAGRRERFAPAAIEVIGLPAAVGQAIEDEVARVSPPALVRAAAELGRCYQEESGGRAVRFDSREARLAYVVARMPAIFRVNQLVYAELGRSFPAIDITNLLDLGCGPGSATLAARQILGGLQSATLADRDPEWLEISRRLVAASDPQLAAASRYTALDLCDAADLGEHDLVTVSYALGELPPHSAGALVQRAWNSARRAIVIVEPGTPHGFAVIIAARDLLIAAQARIVAPCTQAERCPLAAAEDWCHFDTRVERTSRHRSIKSANRPYEIEKFSYLIAAREPPPTPPHAARIIRHPLKKSGHVVLDLCNSAGAAERSVISRRNKPLYRQARAAKWGGLWPPDSGEAS
ncbi:MAG TPA: small ribosomal subunit Rsm22 family protein [Candidatus Binataceae bacterium]|nr:small ribosomal subunit Rsm22 family protein [Candidatus Binataceae bacterium]